MYSNVRKFLSNVATGDTRAYVCPQPMAKKKDKKKKKYKEKKERMRGESNVTRR